MSLIRRSILAALATALIATLTAPAGAQSTLETVRKRGKLIAGVKTDFPPFGTVDAAGRNVGFDVDVAHRFARALFNDENQVELVAVTSGNRIPFLQSSKIDVIIAESTEHWDLERMAVVDRNILRMAVYELLYEPDVPGKVAINEAIEIAKKFGTAESSRFINGVLDRIHRELRPA